LRCDDAVVQSELCNEALTTEADAVVQLQLCNQNANDTDDTKYNRRLVVRYRAMWYNPGVGDGERPARRAASSGERSKTMTNAYDEYGPSLDAHGEYGPAIHPDVAADMDKARSVVKNAYKRKYAERARSNGHASKVAQRSTWDWLAQSLAGECNQPSGALDVDAFLALLDANGVDHSRWTNRSKGWEGRLRMTGRLALQRVVAAAGALFLPDGEELVPPAEWVAKFQN